MADTPSVPSSRSPSQRARRTRRSRREGGRCRDDTSNVSGAGINVGRGSRLDAPPATGRRAAGGHGERGGQRVPRILESSTSSFTIDALWLFPIQKVAGVVAFCTKTRRTFVKRGSRYSTDRPLFGSSRRMRLLYSPPLQTMPALSIVTSYGQAPGV